MTHLRALQRQAWQINEDHGFHDDRPEGGPELVNWIGNKLMLIVSEAAEAQDELRTGHAADETYYPTAKDEECWPIGMFKPEGVPSELADIVIRVLDLCATEGIDLEDFVEEKLLYNAQRPYKHGKKF